MGDPSEPLSEREIEILKLVATGASNKEIASSLVISPNTVKVHLRNIFAKIGVVSRTEATLYAIKSGLVKHAPDSPSFEDPSEAQDLAQAEIYRISPMVFSNDGPEGLSRNPASKAAQRPAPFWMTILIIALVLIALSVAGLYLNRSSLNLFRTQTPPTAKNSAMLRWQSAPGLPVALNGMGMVVYDTQYYLFGGSDGKTVSNAVYRSADAGKTWVKVTRKPLAVTDVKAVMISEMVYIPGGKTADGKISAQLDVFDPRQNQWQTKKPLPVGLSGYGLVAFEGRLYCFGGWDGQQYSKVVYIYDPKADQWSTGTPLPTARAFFAVSAIDGKVILAGGYDGKLALKDVLIYFPSREGTTATPWAQGPDLPQARYNTASASLANMVYLFGGQSDSSADKDLPAILLDGEQSAWVNLDPAPQPIGANALALTSGNFIHIFGGVRNQTVLAQQQVYQAIYTINIPLTTN
jgi:DNA-binding CsgD family transcriptional regulator/N-acetylneuraminic acid mutarotase